MAEVIKLHKKIILICIALLVSINCPYSSFADTIILNDGSEIRGLIIENLEEKITLRIKYGMRTIKKENIQSIKEEKIPVDLALTEDGVEDQWGLPIPPYPLDIEMVLSAVTNLESESKNEYYENFLSLAEEYEERAKSKSILELRQVGLMTALVYYRIGSNSPNKSIKETSQKGLKRCSGQLFNPNKGKIAIPYGTSMAEHINRFIGKLDTKAEKKAYTDIYFEMGQDYETKAETSSEKQLKNIRIAMNCYQIVMTYSPDEESKFLARRNYQRCSKELRDIHIAEENE